MSRTHHSTPKVATGPSTTKRTEQRKAARTQRQQIRQEIRRLREGADPDTIPRTPRVPRDLYQNFFW